MDDKSENKTTKKPVKSTEKSARTRESILSAGREAFLQYGFDGVGVREICKNAGVNAALVNRYFGSKLGLFREILDDETDYSELYNCPLSELGERLARFVISGLAETESGVPLDVDPERILLFIRSVGSPEALPALRESLNDKVTSRLIEVMPVPNSREKAAIITSHLFGFVLIHRMVGAACMVKADKDIVRIQLAQSIQAVIDHNPNE